MKLLCISRKHPPSVGGMQRMNYELIRRLALETDATVVRWGHSQLLLPLFLPWALLRSLCMLPKSKRPDVIYLGDALLSPLGLILKVILRRPVVVTAHGRDLTFRFPLYRRKIGFSIMRLDRVIVVSRHTRELCLAMGVPPERCITIPNGVNPEEHVPTPQDVSSAREWLRAREIAPDRPIIMTVGRLVRRKGVAHFIANILPLLVKTRPGLLYLIVGEGREKKEIEAATHAQNLAGNILLARGIPREILRGLMGIAKVFVMPNIPVADDVEGFGLVALEANCAGLPVVASDLEGIRDAVEDGTNGFLIRYDDRCGFAGAIVRLLSDEKARAAMGARARGFVSKNFTWDICAERYLGELARLKH